MSDIDWTKFTVSSDTFTFSKIPVGDITVYGDKHYYVYKPTPDISAYELSKLLRLFVIATTATGNGLWSQYDFEGFIIQNQLEKHFEKKER